MKRSRFSRPLKHTLLAVPACALMLGAANAGTTVGLNFQAWYYDSGTNPQTVGFGAGYQTTGFPVTATAFGVTPSNWWNTDPLPNQAAIPYGSTLFGSTSSLAGGSNTFAGTLTLQVTAPNSWMSGIGEQVAGWNPETVAPGDYEVTWGYLDDGNVNGQAPSAMVSGLAAKFPNGYVVQTIAANSGVKTFNNVDITDGVTTNTVAYATTYVVNPVNDGYDTDGTYGLSAASGVFTNDVINIDPEPKTTGNRSVLCGFIITDQPVVSTKPVGGTYNLGSPFTLTAGAAGIPPISYQWLLNGAPVPGATNSTYAVASAAAANGGNYQLVATNAYGSGTSVVASVNVLLTPTFLSSLEPLTNYPTMNATLSASVGGQSPIACEWLKNGVFYTSTTNAALTFADLQASNDADYQLVITNVLGATTSSVVHLTVLASLPPYEGFDYNTNSTPLSATTAGGTGWSGGWIQTPGYNGESVVVAPPAPYHDTSNQLVSVGGAAELAGTGAADFEDIRSLQCSLGNGTVYLSFFGEVTNTGWGGVELVDTLGTNDVASIFLGSQWYAQGWGWGDRGGGGPACAVPASTLSLLVYRFDFSATNTFVRMYVNPALSGGEPATPTLSGNWPAFTFNKIRLVAHGPGVNDGIVDELRVGGSWSGVTPATARTDAPSLVRDLTGTTACLYAGMTPALSVSASGAPPLSYLWLKNGATPVGSDSPSLTTALGVADSGNYSVIVSNLYGGVSSSTDEVEVVSAPGLYVESTEPDAPEAWWPLNETNYATAYDYSGAGNNGTPTGNATPGVPGPVPPADQGFPAGNTAYLFDGSSAYVSCGTGPSLAGTTDFTLEAWVNTTNAAAGEIIQQRSSTGYNGEYQFAVNANGTLSFSVFGGNASQFQFSSPIGSKYVNDGKWHHVAAVRSGVNGIIYIDGSAVASAAGTSAAPLDPTIATYIGFDQRGNSTFFGGLLCNVAIYGTALSPARIAAHAQAGVLGSSPLVLASTAGGFIEDSKPAGTSHPGFNYGATWLASVTDNASPAVTRTGVEQFPMGRQIVIPASPDFNTTNGTICFWVMAPPPPSTGNGTILFDRRTTAGTLMYYDSGGTINLQTAGGANSFTSGYLGDGNWHHVALTYDQSAGGTVSVYVDGTLSSSQANSSSWTWPSAEEIELGRSHDTYWQNFNGLMDDVRIYNRILTATEVGSVYSSDALVDTNALVLRYNFGTAAGVGTSLGWPVGALQSTPALVPAAWSPATNASLTIPYLMPGGIPATTNSSLFYRVGY